MFNKDQAEKILASFNDIKTMENHLSSSLSCGIIGADDVRDLIFMKKEQMALAMHEQKIYHGKGKDTRWFTYIVDKTTGKRKKVGKKSKDDLIEYLYEYYFERTESFKRKSLLLSDIYEEWMKYRLDISNRASTVRRNDSDYKKYYLNEPLSEKIMTTPLDKLTKNDLEKWAYLIIKKYNMTQKTYSNMSLIIRQIYIYLMDEDILEKNPFERVHIRNTAFKKQRKKAADTQIFSSSEREKLFPIMYAKAMEELDETYLAFPLIYYSGLRPGECMGLKFEDFNANTHTVYVNHSLMKQDRRNEDGTWATSTYEIEECLKQNADPREVTIPEDCLELVKKIKYIHIKKGIIRPYLFDVKTINNIEMKLYKLCDELGIKRRSPNKFRKTYVSELLNNNIDSDFVRRQVGHKDIQTTLNSYTYSTTSNDEMLKKISNVL